MEQHTFKEKLRAKIDHVRAVLLDSPSLTAFTAKIAFDQLEILELLLDRGYWPQDGQDPVIYSGSGRSARAGGRTRSRKASRKSRSKGGA